MQDKACVHVCKSDKKETSAGKLMWVVQCLNLLCNRCCLAQCDRPPLMLTLLLHARLNELHQNKDSELKQNHSYETEFLLPWFLVIPKENTGQKD